MFLPETSGETGRNPGIAVPRKDEGQWRGAAAFLDHPQSFAGGTRGGELGDGVFHFNRKSIPSRELGLP